MTLWQAILLWNKSRRKLTALEGQEITETLKSIQNDLERLKTNATLFSVNAGEMERLKARVNALELRLGLGKHQGIS